jgi:hypothetical protein
MYGDWTLSIQDPRRSVNTVVVTPDSLFFMPSNPSLFFENAVTEACAR